MIKKIMRYLSYYKKRRNWRYRWILVQSCPEAGEGKVILMIVGCPGFDPLADQG